MTPARLPEHPYRKYATSQLRNGIIGLVLAGGLTLFAVLNFPPAAVPCGLLVVLSGMLARLASRNRRDVDALVLNNHADDLVARGEVAEAEELLSRARATTGHVGQTITIHRAMIALHRADLSTAEARASEAIAFRANWLERDAIENHRTVAHGVRALARVSLGNHANGSADIAFVRGADGADVKAIAMVAIAEMIILARRGDHDALTRALESARPLLDFMTPRFRALVSAFGRMLGARTSSAYREPGRTDDTAANTQLATWTTVFAPEAASFVQQTRYRVTAADVARSTPIEGSDARARTKSGRSVFVLVLLFLTVLSCHALVGSDEATLRMDALDEIVMAITGGVSLLLVGVLLIAVGGSIRRAVAGQRAIRRALRAVGNGDAAMAGRMLDELARGGPPSVTASAQLELAWLADRRGDMPTALAHCDAGLSVLARPMLAALHSDLLRPGLIAQRAFALAALGQEERAEEELESLASAHPGYAYLTRSLFRVRLVTALRRSDLARATEIAHGRTPALPLSWRDEVLADVVVALDSSDPRERARLQHELAADIELAHWIEFIAPAAHARLAGTMPACPGA